MKKIKISKELLEKELSKNQTKIECARNLGIEVTTFRKLCRELGVSNYTKQNYRRGKSLPTYRPDINKDWLIQN